MMLTRRNFLVSATAAPLLAAAPVPEDNAGWASLFDGHSLDGWQPSEHKDAWKIVGGQIAADGARSHLFYNGPVHGADFKNFELEVELRALAGCNSGVYFHTRYQETGFPIKGFEVQVNNTATGEGTYRERKKTGSLYGVRNVYKQFIPDDQWFKIRIAVLGKNVKIRLNDLLVVDYIEPTPPVIPAAEERERFLDRGTFALQCHNQGSRAFFRSVRVRPLQDDVATPGGPAPEVDETFRQVIAIGRNNYPMVDYHVNLKSGLTLQQALDKSRRDGISYGVAAECGKSSPVKNDAGVRQFAARMKDQPVFLAMQAEGREWPQMFSRQAAALFDYVFTDSMTWTDDAGKRRRLWIPGEVGAISDPHAFMEMLVARTIGILEREPIDIYANPTFLPGGIAKDYDRLWTEERARKVFETAARNQVAIEINDRYKLPSAALIKMAKAAGCKFSFGTNNTGPADLGRCEYGLSMVRDCRLGWQDFFVPGSWWPKAVERKGETLKA